MSVVTLYREAATALLKEARRDFENAVQEFWNGDESQRPWIDGCEEIIGRMAYKVEHWPQVSLHEEVPHLKSDKWDVEFEFSDSALAWVEHTAAHQVAFVEDLDAGVCGTDMGYTAEQVYILHVLRNVAAQGKEVEV